MSMSTRIATRAHAEELLTHTRWSAERLAAHQRARLDDLLRHAVAASPFYRRTIGPHAVGAPLAELPTLDKQTFVERFDEIVTDPRLRLPAVQAHLAGPDAAEPLLDHHVFSTSGSTGEPALFVSSRAEFACWVGLLMRTLALLGVVPHLRLLGLGSPSPLHISRHLVAGLLAGRPSAAPRTSAETPLPEIVAACNAFQPQALVGYPSVHALLAQEQLAGRLRIAPSVVAYAGEVLTPDMRDGSARPWGVEPASMYSTTEAAMIASGCRAGVGMHVWEDAALVEVVDEHHRPVPPGVPGHHLLLTNLVNHAQPLIRYEISDIATLADGPNPTGMPFRRLAAVDGRSDDVVHLPAASAAPSPCRRTSCGRRSPPSPACGSTRSATTARGSRWRSCCARAPRPRRPPAVRTALPHALVAIGAALPPIRVDVVAEIPREAGPGAKLKTVVVRPRSAGRPRPAARRPGPTR